MRMRARARAFLPDAAVAVGAVQIGRDTTRGKQTVRQIFPPFRGLLFLCDTCTFYSVPICGERENRRRTGAMLTSRRRFTQRAFADSARSVRSLFANVLGIPADPREADSLKSITRGCKSSLSRGSARYSAFDATRPDRIYYVM